MRCPTLPEHIPCDVHDVASAFKRFLSGLPGGILGSLRVFDSLISIQTQLHAEPEWTRTKNSKIRARLMALAILTVKSQYRRDLICAVFGLLCMIGRATATTPREDDKGRPLPTSDLMGYESLGIIFGPLLIGDLLEGYSMRLADPRNGLVILPISPPKTRKERKKRPKHTEQQISFDTYLDKIKVASGVTEMLIVHWREVVKHMRNLKANKTITASKSLANIGNQHHVIRPSNSENFVIRKPADWDQLRLNDERVERGRSPTPAGRKSIPQVLVTVVLLTIGTLDLLAIHGAADIGTSHRDSLRLHHHRDHNRNHSFQTLTGVDILSPTREEHSKEEFGENLYNGTAHDTSTNSNITKARKENERSSISSRYSQRSIKSEPGATPSGSGKLRKPRPPQNSNEIKLSVPRTRSKRQDIPQVSDLKMPLRPVNQAQARMDDVVQETRTKEGKLKQLFTFKPVSFNESQKQSSHPAAAVGTNGTIERVSRRIADSEPIQKPISTRMSRRAASRSLNLPSQNTTKVIPVHGSWNPLTSITSAEDLASLAALARVIKNEDVAPLPLSLTMVASSAGRSSSPVAASPAGILRGGHFDTKQWSERSLTARSPTRDTFGHASIRSVNQNSTSISTTVSSNLAKRISVHQISTQSESTPKRFPEESPVKSLNSPRPSVKALAARFNSGFVTQKESSKTSPGKLDMRGRSVFTSSNDGLLASYTTNTPSPTRSLKSTKAEKILDPTQQVLEGRLVSASLRTSPAKDALLGKDMSIERDTDVLQDHLYPTEAITRELSNPLKHITDLIMRGSPLPPTTTQENVIRTLDGHDSVSSGASRLGSSSSLSSLLKLYEAQPEGEQDMSFLAVNSEDSILHVPDNTLASETESLSIDQAHEIILESDHVQADTPTGAPQMFSASEVRHSLGLPYITPTSSVLRTQIRGLQKQLVKRNAEIEDLKRLLNARSDLEAGTVNKQLREARREAKTWKLKTERLENQIEVLSIRIARGPSLRLRARVSVPDSLRNGRIDLAPGVRRSGSHGSKSDGQEDLDRNVKWTSEETTDTVVKTPVAEDQSADSGCTIWLENTLRELGESDRNH